MTGITLLRRYDISYKKRFSGIAAGLLTAIIIVGLVLNFSGVSERIGRSKQFQPLFREQFAGKGWVAGKVLSVEEKKMVVATSEGNEVTIVWDENTLLPSGADFKPGKSIRAVGRWQDDNTFFARGIGQGGIRPQLVRARIKGIRRNRGPGRRPRR